MKRYICIHGHFYQPPRENPWLEEVEMQDSAFPYHDWNERIHAECYGPNATSRILDNEGYIVSIKNNYARINFNFGPTLLSWMERHQPKAYGRILQADRDSLEYFNGHGAAIAQVYNHMIMPLANRRDKRTQAFWGLVDFRRRFGRDPEGMWLPETAVDLETLEILVDLGIKYTILAPRQAARVRRLNDKNAEWQDVSDSRIDPSCAYVCRLPSGRDIHLFFYDGPIAQDLAFGDLLKSGTGFKNRLMAAFTDGRDWDQLVHIAVDGETFGHHHHHAEMALSYCLELINDSDDVELINYGRYLELHDPVFEVEIFEDSSWSCIHGVERWRSDCGCNSGGRPNWTQAWRAPLREALNWLRDQAAEVFEENGARYFKDPWGARERYINVILDRSDANLDRFLSEEALSPLGGENVTYALKLLEMQRFAQLIFTSCAWFFDEISGIETMQILQYAARTLQLAEELSSRFFEEQFIEDLQAAPSNVLANGAEAFRRHAQPAKIDMLRVGAHFAISSLFEEETDEYDLASYTVIPEMYNRRVAGRSRLAAGKARIASKITRQDVYIFFGALNVGDHNLACGVDYFGDFKTLRDMEAELVAAFERGDITEAIRVIDDHFGRNTYSIWHLFRDDQRRVVNEVLEGPRQTADASLRQIFNDNYTILNFLEWLNIPAPRHFMDAALYVVNTDLKRLFKEPEVDEEELGRLMNEAWKWSLSLERETLAFIAAQWVNQRLADIQERGAGLDMLVNINGVLDLLEDMPLGLHLWKAQNRFFEMGDQVLPKWRKAAGRGDRQAEACVDAFLNLGLHLKARLS